MPTLSASDYTAFVKAQAASLAYRNGAIPKTIQTGDQPFAVQSALNARLLASQAALVITPRNAAINNTARVRPFVGTGNVNNPKNLSTTHASTSTTMSSGKYQQLGGLPLTSAKSDGVYSPVPHLARVDTRATGAYKSVRPPPFS